MRNRKLFHKVIFSAVPLLFSLVGNLQAISQTFTTKQEFEKGSYQDVLITDGNGGEITIDPLIQGLKQTGFVDSHNIIFGNIHSFGLVKNGNNLIVLGGKTQSDFTLDTVYSAPIKSGGEIGAAKLLLKLPAPMSNPGVTLLNTNIYVISSDGSQKVFIGALSNGGEVSSWIEGLSVPFKIRESEVVSIGNKIYVFSASGDGRILIGTVNPNGSISKWEEVSNRIQIVKGFAVFAYKGKIYISGGVDKYSAIRKEAYVVTLDENGNLSGYTFLPDLPIGLSNHAMFIKGENIFIVGGLDGFGKRSDIFKGKLKSDGNIISWELEQTFRSPISDHRIVTHNNYFYLIGGKRGITDSDISKIEFEVVSAPSKPRYENNFALSDGGMLAVDGRLFMIGGRDVNYNTTTAVYSSAIDGNGAVGVFQQTSSLPKRLKPKNTFYKDGRAYLIGSDLSPDGGVLDSMYSVYVNTDGQFTDYRYEGGITGNFKGHFSYFQASMYKDQIYILRDGGLDTRLVSTKINSDGTLAVPIPQNFPKDFNVFTPCVAAGKGRLYFYGRGSGNTINSNNLVYSAPINSDGFVGDWREEILVPFDRESKTKMRVMGDYLYLIGGTNYLTDGSWDRSIYVSKINIDGTLGAWTNIGSVPEDPDRGYSLAMADLIGRLYIGPFNTGTPDAIKNTIVSIGQPSYSNGLYYSQVYDLGSPRNLKSVSWSRAINPFGSKLGLSLACSTSSVVPLSQMELLINGSQLDDKECRYIQYSVNIEVGGTSDDLPYMESVTFNHDPDFIDSSHNPQLVVSSVTSDSISINLTDNSLGENTYIVSVSTEQNPTNNFLSFKTDLNKNAQIFSLNLSGLKSQRDYYIRARSYNSDENVYGPYSVEITTKTLIKKLSTPTSFYVSSDQYSISWSTSPDLTCFKIFDENKNLLKTLNGTDLSFVETKFDENQKIYREVKACNDDTDVLISTFQFYTGIKPPEPNDVKIVEKGDTWLTVSIKPPSNSTAEKTSAILRVVRESNPSDIRIIKLLDPEFITTIKNLAYGEKYSVVASYTNGDGTEFGNITPALNESFGLASENFGVQNTKFVANQGIDFQFNSNSPVNGSIKIYNVNQEFIRELSVDVLSGPSSVHWDGKDSNGSYVHTDVYWAVIDTNKFGKKVINVAAIR